MFFGQNSTSSMATTFPGGGNIIRQAFSIRGTPTETIEISLSSLKPSTLRQYEGPIKKWWTFCTRTNVNIFNASTSDLLTFLTTEYGKEATYSTINSYRSAIALILGPEIGVDDIVKRFCKSISNFRPPRPKYSYAWNPKKVLDYLSTLSPNNSISINELSYKLISLLALVTGHRIQTFSLIKLNNIVVSDENSNKNSRFN